MTANSIKLNFDISDVSIIQGDAKSISSGDSNEYISMVQFLLPPQFNNIPIGEFSVKYNEIDVNVKTSSIPSSDADPIIKNIGDIQFGTPNQSGIPDELPIEVFTDNKGIYPITLATLSFPFRIATWIDDEHPTGIKMDLDYEAMRISGSPDNEEKILALRIINRFLDTLENSKLPAITYDDVTVFIETYFDQSSNTLLLIKANALCSKTAYKNSVQEFYLQDIDSPEFNASITRLENEFRTHEIQTEADLFNIVKKAIVDILIHHIENRRWIEPFWDGKRNVRIEGVLIPVPRVPKPESKIQPTIQVVLDMALKPLGIQVARESNEGIGAMDFRFFYTTSSNEPLTIGAEFKVAHHKKLKHGIVRQLPAYMKSLNSSHGLFLVMWFKDDNVFLLPKGRTIDQLRDWLVAEAKEIRNGDITKIDSLVIDASIRSSASNV